MKVSVIGAGSWGTALANLLASQGNDVCMWARKPEVCESINTRHVNPRYLVNSTLDERLRASSDFAEVLKGAEAVVVVTPSSILRQTAEAIAPYITSVTPIVICSKGVEEGTGLLPVEIFEDVLGHLGRLAGLTGPNHAEEVIKALPSGTVIAAFRLKTAKFFQELFAAPYFRTYVSSDVIGAEICAAYKNVVAIAVGAAYGMGLGDNTASLIMTRGLAEMGRLVTACGGNSMTCMGLAGVGDLEVTCMSEHSRNRTFGYRLAKGTTLEEYKAETHMVVEGAVACRTLHTLASEHGVDLPIAQAVRAIVWEGATLQDVAVALLDRPLKAEF
ncbi:NAD(P)H-dependent glycerol-3-phosphate dehydrogenase [Slackia heliotrinireducens]|uniref:NAD(P)H-dependent glycerol-3-phosphate dehydrogenase n=1 Tax=Slackia heliotrinireducens TaxID=84110 RepID=UPI003316394D